ncbi:unnamed protein product [Musa hybrid cultivar]
MHPSRPDFERPPSGSARTGRRLPAPHPVICAPTLSPNYYQAIRKPRFESEFDFTSSTLISLCLSLFEFYYPTITPLHNQPFNRGDLSELEERRVGVREANWARRRWRSGRNGTG